MARSGELNFVQQQGFKDAGTTDCGRRYPALMFQPRIVGALAAAGIVFQSWILFLILSAVLWWNVLLPRLNPFDALYNRLLTGPGGPPPLTPAPAPRRFAQGMAASFMLVIGVSLLSEWETVAWVFQALLLVALVALIFGKFCLGSYIFHLLKGDAKFANRTLPWIRED